MSAESILAVIVPSLGLSPIADQALAHLRAELAGAAAELVWVHQGAAAPPALDRPRERLILRQQAAGFAAGVNFGISVTETPYVAVVNDDVQLHPGWLSPLIRALEGDAQLSSVQGVVVQLRAPERCDGCGLGWNRWWQAMQLCHGAEPPGADSPNFEIFGVSATAALYRRSALAAVDRPRASPFDERLGSWYEDVDLAARLRASGWRALAVPAARAAHLGSATGGRQPFRRDFLLARNRLLVVSRLLGRRFAAELPRLLVRDLVDGSRALSRGRIRLAGAIASGWLAAAVALPQFAHLGRPLLEPASLAHFRVGSRR